MATQAEKEARRLYAKFLAEAMQGRKPLLEDYIRLCPVSEAERLHDALVGIELSVRDQWTSVAPSSVARTIQALESRAAERKVLDQAQARLKEIAAKGLVAKPDEALASCLGLPHTVTGANSRPAFQAFGRGEVTGASKAKIDRFWLKIKEPQIKALAENVLRKAEIDSAPVNLAQITRMLSLVIEMAELPDSLEGCLVTDGNVGGILINSLVSNARRRRYTWAHELGHFALHKGKRIFEDSRATVNDTSGSTVETEANIFASMLLLPDMLMPPRLLGSKVIFSDADMLAAQFDVSLEACLRRLIRASDWPCALVVSRDGIAERIVSSDMFTGFVSLKQQVKLGTVVASLGGFDAGEERTAEMPAGFWIEGWSTSWDTQLVREETRTLPNGFMYTLLTLAQASW